MTMRRALSLSSPKAEKQMSHSPKEGRGSLTRFMMRGRRGAEEGTGAEAAAEAVAGSKSKSKSGAGAATKPASIYRGSVARTGASAPNACTRGSKPDEKADDCRDGADVVPLPPRPRRLDRSENRVRFAPSPSLSSLSPHSEERCAEHGAAGVEVPEGAAVAVAVEAVEVFPSLPHPLHVSTLPTLPAPITALASSPGGGIGIGNGNGGIGIDGDSSGRGENVLFQLIASKRWDDVHRRAFEAPHESSRWVTVAERDGAGVSAEAEAEALASAPAPRPTREFAAHLACALGAPPSVVLALIRADTAAAMRCDPLGRTVLHWAVGGRGDQGVGGQSDEHHADADAAAEAAVSLVDLLLSLHPDAARVREHRHGCTPLHVACSAFAPSSSSSSSRPAAATATSTATATAIVRKLLCSFPDGACCRDASSRGWTPLHAAVHCGAPSPIVRALLESNPAAASVPDRDGRLPLHFAARYADSWDRFLPRRQSRCSRCCRASEGGDGKNDKDNDEDICCYDCNSHDYSVNGEYGDGTDKNNKNKNEKGYELTMVLEALIEAYPDSLKRREGKNGYTPLHAACSTSHQTRAMRALLSIFLRKGCAAAAAAAPPAAGVVKGNGSSVGGRAALSIPDHDQRLPLHVAAQARQPSWVLRELLRPNPTSAADRDKDGRLALHWACMSPSCSLSSDLEALAEAKEELMRVSVLVRAVPRGAAAAECRYGWIPLHAAVWNGMDGRVVALLLRAFPDGARTKDCFGSLPLHVACRSYCAPVCDHGEKGEGEVVVVVAEEKEKEKEEEEKKEEGEGAARTMPLTLSTCLSSSMSSSTSSSSSSEATRSAPPLPPPASPSVAAILLHAYPEGYMVKDKKGRTALDLLKGSSDGPWKTAMKAVLGNEYARAEV